MKALVLAALVVLMLSCGTASSQNPAGIRIRGKLAGYPVNAPGGLFSVDLVSPGLMLNAPIGAGGAFEFQNVPPGNVLLQVGAPRTISLRLENQAKDADGVELTSRDALPLLGQVTLEDGAHMPNNANPSLPVLRLEARGAVGNTISHQFVRSDGVFGFLRLPPDDYTFRVTLVPEGYSVKSILYGNIDALRNRVALSAAPYSFLRIILSKTSSGATGERPQIATVAPPRGDATVVVSQRGRAQGSAEGFQMFFVVRNADGTFYDDRRFGGEFCSPTLQGPGNSPCRPGVPVGNDSMAISVAPGDYYVASYLIFGMDGPTPRTECWAAVTVRSNETATVERFDRVESCTMSVKK